MVTTVGEVMELLSAPAAGDGLEASLAWEARDMLQHNLRVLRDAGTKIVIGSDRYRTTNEPEVAALRSTGLFSDTALIRMWSVDTPRAIFPQRDIGSFESGYEASFVGFDGNPLEDFSALRRIRLRMKEGVILP